MKKGSLLIIAVILTLGITFMYSCSEKEEIVLDESAASLKCTETPPQTCMDLSYDLIAGQYMNVGKLIVSNDETNLYVEYDMDCDASEFHLFVGNESDIPLNKKGTPVIGHFPYYNTTGMFTIPLADLPDCFVIAAHAVCGEETIWAFSSDDNSFEEVFGTTRWGWVTDTICPAICNDPELILGIKTCIAPNDWGVLVSDWHIEGHCDYVGYVNVTLSELYDHEFEIVHWTDPSKTGTMTSEKVGDEIVFTLSMDDPELSLLSVYFFLGTQEALDWRTTENGCIYFSYYQLGNTISVPISKYQ